MHYHVTPALYSTNCHSYGVYTHHLIVKRKAVIKQTPEEYKVHWVQIRDGLSTIVGDT